MCKNDALCKINFVSVEASNVESISSLVDQDSCLKPGYFITTNGYDKSGYDKYKIANNKTKYIVGVLISSNSDSSIIKNVCKSSTKILVRVNGNESIKFGDLIYVSKLGKATKKRGSYPVGVARGNSSIRECGCNVVFISLSDKYLFRNMRKPSILKRFINKFIYIFKRKYNK